MNELTPKEKNIVLYGLLTRIGHLKKLVTMFENDANMTTDWMKQDLIDTEELYEKLIKM